MNSQRRRVLVAGVAAVAFGAVALAQPKERVIRVTARNVSIGVIRKAVRRPAWGRRMPCQAKVMLWSLKGTERMRLPVAAK